MERRLLAAAVSAEKPTCRLAGHASMFRFLVIPVGLGLPVFAGCGRGATSGGGPQVVGTPSSKPFPPELRVLAEQFAVDMKASPSDFRDNVPLSQTLADLQETVLALQDLQSTDPAISTMAERGLSIAKELAAGFQRLMALPKPPSSAEIITDSFSGEVRKNVHFERRWPAQSWMSARYAVGQELLGCVVDRRTVTRIQSANVRIWSPLITTLNTCKRVGVNGSRGLPHFVSPPRLHQRSRVSQILLELREAGKAAGSAQSWMASSFDDIRGRTLSAFRTMIPPTRRDFAEDLLGWPAWSRRIADA